MRSQSQARWDEARARLWWWSGRGSAWIRYWMGGFVNDAWARDFVRVRVRKEGASWMRQELVDEAEAVALGLRRARRS